MLLLTHILIALTSIVISTSLLMSPSRPRLRMSYGMIAGSFVSGTLLILGARSHLLEACLMGLAYSAFTLVATVGASRKLARSSVRTDHIS